MPPSPPVADDADRRAALALVPVSRETEARFALFAERLRDWQRIKNLVAPSTLDHIWSRHIADCAQLPALAPEARRWADLGSGAGFPGIVVALMLHGVPGAEVHLIESNTRKAAFLREVVRMTGAPAIVHADRIEAVLPTLPAIDIVTARALAALPALIAFSRSLLDCGATGLFLSGEQAGVAAADSGMGLPYLVEAIPSRTHPHGRILRVWRGARDPGAGGIERREPP